MKKITIFLLLFLSFYLVRSQCTAPAFNVNLSAKADTTWTLSGQTRGGVCCGSSNCVTFTVTTNPGTELISFDVTSPSPSGSAYYQVNCGTPVSIGTPLCIVGLPSPFTITYCKPGGDHPNYVISAMTVVHASNDISIQKTGCVDTLTVSNVLASSVVWTSIYPGVQGAYNSYLSCTSGCTSTLVTPGPSPPPYVDYQVSGNPSTNCGPTFNKDTVRVYFVPTLSVSITPSNPVICASSGTNITLTANPSGGAAPYNYSWSNGSHNQSITVTAAGTYTVVVGDKTKCPKVTLTKTIATLPVATFTYSPGAYCKNGTNPLPVYSGGGMSGAFSASPAGLSFANTTTGEINLAASTSGTYTVTNSIAASGGCPNVSATAVVTIYPFPTMTSVSTATICTGSAVNIPLTSSFGSTYSWIAADNSNTTGESLTAQTTSTLNNTIVNGSSSAQTVIYTVTPTATVSGGCIGAPQTVSVTVNPMDNAGFTYPSSTNCQTGTNPTPIITGLSGGTFSSTSGLTFVSTSTGVINLSASSIGTYTITYSTHGVCPNTATYPITITTAPSANFSYTSSPYCQSAANPFPTFGSGASGGVFTSQAGLVFVNSSTGEVNLAASTPGTYTVTNTIAAGSGCAAANATGVITITALKSGSFDYAGSPYCKNGTNPLPTFTGGGVGGVFSSQAGLSLNSGSGSINLSASTAGTYTVTNTVAATGGCPVVTAIDTVTITALPVASFTYIGTPYCNNAANPSPIFIGGGVAGVFSASSVFLNVNPSTGVVDLSSVSGSFLVTNTIDAAGGCPAVSATAPITITSLPIATFNYSASPYCQNGSDPTPILDPNGTNGNYTFSPVGLNINSSAGTINLAGSTPGTYTITNTISPLAGCPSVVASSTVQITALPVGTFNYAGSPYCQNQSNPLPTFTGGGISGVFSSSAGLVINSSSGSVDIASSTPGTYTVTNTIAAQNGCPSVIETATITIRAMDNSSFNYPGSTFCKTGVNPSPTITGLAGGVFSSASLSVNAGTGVINLGASPLGTYTVMYTTTGFCPTSSTTSITITNAPSSAFSYSGLTFCTSGINPAPIYAGGASGGVFSSSAGISVDPVTGAINLSGSTAGTYTVTNTIAASGGCATATAQTTITINPEATTTANTDQIICYGSNAVLAGVIGGGASSATWAGGAGTFSPSASTLGASYVPTTADSLAGVVTLTLTTNDPAGVCPAVNDIMTISINQPATANANTDQTICYGTSVTLAGAIGGSATSATWTGGSGIFTPDAITLNTGYAPTTADSTAGSVTFTLTTDDPAGICPAVNDLITININQPATAKANSNQAICYGTTVTLAGAVGGSATSGTWSGGTGTFSPNANTLGAVYTPTAADSASGLSVLTLTTNDPAGICPAVSDVMLININQPAIVNANTDQTICFGNAVTLAGIVGGSATIGQWTGGNGVFSPNDSTLTGVYAATSADSLAGVITLTLTTNDPAGACPAVNDIMSITINQPATVNASTDQIICFGSSINLSGAIGGSASSGTWTGGAGAYSPNATSLGAAYIPTTADSLAGTISLTLSTDDPAGVCPAVTDTMKITINQPATVNASASQVICYGSAITLAGTVGGSATVGVWTGGAGVYAPNDSTLAGVYTPTSADSLAGVITLTLTTNDPAGICPAVNDTMKITINQPATVSANADQTICYGSSITLAGAIGGSATSATWTGGAGSYSPNANTVGATYTPTSADSLAGTITLTLTTNDPTGVCPALNDAMTITINQPATVNASASQIICYGSSITLTGTVGGSATIGVWTGGNGTYAPNDSTLAGVYTPTSADSLAGVITLTLTTNDPAGICPAVNDTMKVTINQPATVNASASQIICYGSTITLAGTVGGSATIGVWTGGAGIYAPNDSTLAGVYTPTSADSSAGVITLTLTTNDPAGICPAVNDTMKITINQPATVNANASQVICFGTAVTLAGTVGGSATGATWTGGAGTYSPNASTLGASYAPTSADSLAGVITLTLSTNDPAGVCPAVTDTMKITIHQPVTVTANADQTICYGNAVTLAGAIGGSATSATWTGGAGTYSPNANTVGATYTPTAADSLAGTITLTLTTNDPAGICPFLNDVMTITINQPATVNANSDQTICSGNSVTLAGIIGGSAASGTWTGGTGTYAPSASSLGAVYTPTSADSAAGTITLTLTSSDPAGVCSPVTDVMSIIINPSPPKPVITSGNSATYCQTSAIASINVAGTGTVLWSTNASMSPIIHMGSSYTPGGLPLGTTVYYLVDSLNTGCKSLSTNTVSITINPTPATPTVTAGGNGSYCVGATINPINTSGSSNTIWSTSPTLNPVIHVGSSYTPVGLNNGVNTFYISDSTALGCKSADSTMVTVTLNPNPTLTSVPTVVDAQCGNFNGSIANVVAGGNGPFTYQWYSGATPITGATADSLANIGGGVYSVVVSDANGCTININSVTFTVNATGAVTASFTPSVIQGNAPLAVTFTNTSVGATGYEWIFGNGTTSTSTVTTVQQTYTAAGTYTVVLVASNGTCTGVATQTIVVDGEPSIVIPNIFTPNGDGINDLFFITTVGITELHAEIYNRWGTLIYVLNGVSASWDGKNLKNDNLSDGTYFVILKAKDIDGKTYDKQGYVTLVR
jgi:gliding motility-associated-like protein